MTRPVLVLRPEPGATATARAARDRGLDAVVAPLFAVHPVAWEPPAARIDALLLTSANAVRHGGADLEALRDRRVYAVGAATAAAARRAGFGSIVAGDGDAAAIVGVARARGEARLLHLAGRDHRDAAVDGVRIERRIVYEARAVDRLPDAAARALPQAVALLHSPRAAALFASLVADRATIAVAAISAAVRAAAGAGWRAVAVAQRPADAALLAAAVKLCDH